MTISSYARPYWNRLRNFRCGVENAPEGTFEDAQKIHEALEFTFNEMMENLHKTGLKIANGDQFSDIESMIYGMIVNANPDNTIFDVTEGFGSNMSDTSLDASGTRICDRVLAGIVRDRDFIRGMNAVKQDAEVMEPRDIENWE